MTPPTIRIKDAWLLREAASVPLNELWGDGVTLKPNVFGDILTHELIHRLHKCLELC